MDDVTYSSVEPGEVADGGKIPDRRRSPRRKTWKNGRTLWSNGDSFECIIRNLSETGAQLELRGPVPNRFDLLVEGDQWCRSCSVVWRRENRAGVKFDSPPSFGDNADFRCYVSACSELAERAPPKDRTLLLEMAQAWIKVIHRLQGNARQVL